MYLVFDFLGPGQTAGRVCHSHCHLRCSVNIAPVLSERVPVPITDKQSESALPLHDWQVKWFL